MRFERQIQIINTAQIEPKCKINISDDTKDMPKSLTTALPRHQKGYTKITKHSPPEASRYD